MENLRSNADFREFFISYIEKRISTYQNIESIPEKGDYEKEIYARKQRLAELKDLLHNING